MNATKIIWCFLYFILPLLVLVWAIWRNVDPVNITFTFIAFGLSAIIPDFAIDYADKLGLASTKVERAIIIHVLLTLTAALNVVVWGALMTFRALHRAQRHNVVAIVFMLLCTFFGFATLLFGLYNPVWFVDTSAYMSGTRIRWIWPKTIDAPITYFRIGLSIMIICVPLFNKSAPKVAQAEKA